MLIGKAFCAVNVLGHGFSNNQILESHRLADYRLLMKSAIS